MLKLSVVCDDLHSEHQLWQFVLNKVQILKIVILVHILDV